MPGVGRGRGGGVRACEWMGGDILCKLDNRRK